MNRTVLFLSLALTPLSPGPVFAQGGPASNESQAAAALLERAIHAIGGPLALRAGARLAVVVEGTALSPEQHRSPAQTAAEVRRKDRYLVDADSDRAWLESELVFPGELRFHTRTVLVDGGGFTIDLFGWRFGSDVVRLTRPAATATAETIGRLLPHLVLRQASLRRAELSLREVDGETRLVYPERPAGEVELRLDPATGLLRGYRLLRGGQLVGEIEFAEYHLLDGLMVPRRRVTHVAGAVREDVTLDVWLAPSIDEAGFRLPAGYSDPPAGDEPRAVRLADGVYLLDGMPDGYHAAFVELDDGVAVLEPPHSGEFTAIARRLIAATLPDRPIRWVLVTHHHGDHVAGLAAYLEAEDVTVFASAEAVDAIRRQLGDAGATARIQGIAEIRSLGDGPNRLELHPVPNSHADGNLAFYLPEHEILFQGDLLYLPERGVVTAGFPMAEALHRVIVERGLQVRTIVGVHGRPASFAQLLEAIEKRRAAGFD